MVLLALSDNGYFYVNLKYINKSIDWIASRSYSIYCSHMFSWFLVKKVYSCIEFYRGSRELLYWVIAVMVKFLLKFHIEVRPLKADSKSEDVMNQRIFTVSYCCI